jgi:ABC-2 type transport system ATP-binding protein
MTVTAPARPSADAVAASPAVVCRALSKTYGSVQALRPLDLEVPAGSVFGLLGPNGAGKTTLLHLLTGLRRPTAGAALIDGIPIGRPGPSVGYLDQDPRYYSWMTGAELLGFAGGLCGLRGAELAAAVARAAELAGVVEFMNRRLGGYSGGMRQRLGIAQAIVHSPRVLLLDEPVSSLDPEGRRDVLDVIARLRGSATVVVSTHILADVERVCDRVAILDHGWLLAESEIGALLDRHAAPAYEVELRDAGPDQQRVLVERLARRPWAAAVESRSGRIRVRTSDADAAGRGLIAELAACGLGVDRLQRVRPSL